MKTVILQQSGFLLTHLHIATMLIYLLLIMIGEQVLEVLLLVQMQKPPLLDLLLQSTLGIMDGQVALQQVKRQVQPLATLRLK
ncbi:MAG: hypothetical protein CMF74_16495 [Maricaulis sp.]|nr:hypothetical protein [Maricaulis sp.]